VNFYDELLAATAAERTELQSLPLVRDALAGRVTRDEYLRFLANAWHHVRYTVPLMMACGARLSPERSGLHAKLGEYISDEVGHDAWILDDIRAAGGDAEAVRNSLPNAATELMIAYAFDTVNRGNPVGFFGMVHVLEGTSTALACNAAETLQQTLALPKKAFTYLNSHGALDVGHVQFFADLVNSLDRAEDCAAVIHAARMFYRLYGAVLSSARIPRVLENAA